MTQNSSQSEESAAGGASDGNSIDREKAQRAVRLLLEAIGKDPQETTMTETWQRRVPETIETLTEGEREHEKPTLRTFNADTDGLVVKTDIPIYSLCEHHLLPYYGIAHVGYRPDDEVAGLSKLPRYVRWQSRRLTMQESLTTDIAQGLQAELGASVVFVDITATHLCEAMRGIETATETTTRATAGDPTDKDSQQFRVAISTSE